MLSFVEKHKAWLLPVLALGVGGVIYLNIQSFSDTPKPAVPVSPQSSSAPAAAPAPVAAPPSSIAATAPAPGSDLWSDLKAQAFVPDPLGQDEALREMARASLDTQTVIAQSAVMRPNWTRDPKPQPKEGEARGSQPPPDVDFLVFRAVGSRAWFEGRGYNPGENLDGKPFSVRSIAPSSVDLKGPGGHVRRWTNPLHQKGPQAPTEAP